MILQSQTQEQDMFGETSPKKSRLTSKQLTPERSRNGNQTVAALRELGKFTLHEVNDMCKHLLYEEICKTYADETADPEAKVLLRRFSERLNNLKEHEAPLDVLDEFLSKLKQGDFINYRRKDCLTINAAKKIQAKRLKRQGGNRT
jgi:hypothetical protein